MKVDNTGFLIDKLGEDCAPLQWVREFTQNSIEAIQKKGDDFQGRIEWAIDENYSEFLGQRKLCITDNGIGMSSSQLLTFLNHLSSSGSEQAFDKNFGVGAKIAGLTQHPQGLVYLTWQDGAGSRIWLWRDSETGEYGAKNLSEDLESAPKYTIGIDNEAKPKMINTSGTRVVLLGKEKDENTFQPKNVAYSTKWLKLHLNSRYFKFPANVKVFVREIDGKENDSIREANGQEYFLEKVCKKSGIKIFDDVKVHWWILPDDSSISSNYGHFLNCGHIAALFQNELYETKSTSSGGYQALQSCGIYYGFRQVVLYFEYVGSKVVTANIARAKLNLVDGNGSSENLPWDTWFRKFRENLPIEIEEMIQDIANGVSKSTDEEAIAKKLEKYKALFTFSRFKKNANGHFFVENSVIGGVPTIKQVVKEKTGQSHGGDGGSEGDVYALFNTKSEEKGDAIAGMQVPEVIWCSIADGTRSKDFLEDRAAIFNDVTFKIHANKDFRAFHDVLKIVASETNMPVGANIELQNLVFTYFQQQLVEAVLGILAIKDSPMWGPDDLQTAFSAEALTVAIMPRILVFEKLKQQLNSKFNSSFK
jgi:hypothetical protein